MSIQEQRERFEAHFGVPIEQRRAPSAGGYAQREIQMMWAGWLAAEAATIERIAAWIEPQRNYVPATGEEFASAIRALLPKEE